MDSEKLEKLHYLRFAVGTTAAVVAAHIAYLKQPDAWRERMKQWLGVRLARQGIDPRLFNLPAVERAPLQPDRTDVGKNEGDSSSPVRNAVTMEASEAEAGLLAAKRRARNAGCRGLLASLRGQRDASCEQLNADIVRMRLERDRLQSGRS